jgi:cytochrome c
LRIVGDDPFEADVFGSNPKGYLIFTTKGRMAAVLSAADRKPPANDTDNITLMKSFSAYTGKYIVEDDKRTTKVDVSWNGTGFLKIKQPAQPGRKIYPPKCPECLGKGRIKEPTPT